MSGCCPDVNPVAVGGPRAVHPGSHIHKSMPLLNLRDVATTAGPGVHHNVLLRSAQPDALTADHYRSLPRLRLIVDLRDESERVGDDWPESAPDDVRVLRRGMPGSPADLAGLAPEDGLGGFYVRMLDLHADWLASVIAEIA